MPDNSAAWQVAAKVRPLEISPAPYTSPGPGELVIKNQAIAINPVDAMLQLLAFFPLPYPFILGSDVAGEVVEIGRGVTRFKPGQRVLGFGFGSVSGKAAEGSFQHYTVLPENVTAPVPDSVTSAQASALPMGLIVGASGLFDSDYLGLKHPSLQKRSSCSGVILIWGGATAVGCSTIQLAVAAGYEVVTTSSEKNFNLMRHLGASKVFDYRSNSTVDDIVAAVEGKYVVGAFDAAGMSKAGKINQGSADDGSFHQCAAVLQKTNGGKFIAAVQMPPEILPTGIEAKFILAANIRESPLSKVIFEDYLPQALASGKFVPAPKPLVVGHGLESVQNGLDQMIQGVSAQKIVITL